MAEIPCFAPAPPEFSQRDADGMFRQLRSEDPLHWYEPCRFWAVTRYADVQLISQRPRLFTSEQGTQLYEAVQRARGEPVFGAGGGSMSALAAGAPSLLRIHPPP